MIYKGFFNDPIKSEMHQKYPTPVGYFFALNNNFYPISVK